MTVSRFCAVQLSPACALTSAVKSGTAAEHLVSTLADWPATAPQLIEGAWTSLIVTVNVATDEVFPEVSVAVHVTVVTPFAKVEPAGGVQAGVRLASQLSVTLTL